MTPAARYAAAIEVLDAIFLGKAPEVALLAWTRGHRFAGSKDRAAIRDIVFSIDRRRMSCAAMGGGQTGRALVRGYLAQEGKDESKVFGVGGYAPPQVSRSEPQIRLWTDLTDVELSDLQPWVWERMKEQFGPRAPAIADALRHRAPVWVRANTSLVDRRKLLSKLEERGFEPELSDECETAVRIRKNQRRLTEEASFKDGHFEFQDLAPQSAIERLDIRAGESVLDFCAGGGGKSLAVAARGADVTAYDSNPRRMADIPVRAKRAKANVKIRSQLDRQLYDIVLCDVPCSGSGAWRRATSNKWSIMPEDLKDLVELQRKIVAHAVKRVRPGGRLAYMTCSLFAEENQGQTAWIKGYMDPLGEAQWAPDQGSDGFYLSQFRKP